ncbi:Fic family protein [Boseaceae bacterium BT-24-1]|nr:Fic family protein [Boseaceae bacterium BT-24-1]
MFDGNWELINGPDAHHIEILNYTNQVNVIEGLFRLLSGKFGIEATGCPACPTVAALKALHHTGTLFLLEKPGEFRESEVHIGKADGTVVYNPPTWSEVPKHMAEFEAELTAMWPQADVVTVAAFTLWKINWIHPFKNGNGRAARAFAYSCMCLKLGFMLPGQMTVIDLIMTNKPDFEAALGAADKTFAETGEVDLGPMKAFVERLLVEQFQSVPVTEAVEEANEPAMT